jgi:transposase
MIDSESGEVLEEAKIRSTRKGVEGYFGGREPMRVALEVGNNSPWMSRVIEECGHETLVANARQVRLIHGGRRKSDQLDAEKLARLARYDEKLLAPITHRSEQAQADLATIRSRDALVRSRTLLINHVRQITKAFGGLIPGCGTKVFHKRAPDAIPEPLKDALMPLVASIAEINARIRELDDTIERLANEVYSETQVLTQIHNVGDQTALAFMLTLEDPHRFTKSRKVGAFLGLCPGRRQSGDRDPQQRISKEGDEMLRRLLVQAAHRILGKKGKDSDLRRHGLRLIERGGEKPKNRAVVAVARKLAVLMHRLWVTGEVYDPLHNSQHTDPTTQELAA